MGFVGVMISLRTRSSLKGLVRLVSTLTRLVGWFVIVYTRSFDACNISHALGDLLARSRGVAPSFIASLTIACGIHRDHRHRRVILSLQGFALLRPSGTYNQLRPMNINEHSDLLIQPPLF